MPIKNSTHHLTGPVLSLTLALMLAAGCAPGPAPAPLPTATPAPTGTPTPQPVASATAAPASPTPTPTATPAATGPLTAYGVTTDNQLLRFITANPDTTVATVAVTGLAAGETVVGLDFRSAAANSGLYALTSAGRLYRLDTATGVASAVGTAQEPALTGIAQGFDFNPAADRLRIVSGTANRRAHPDTGAVVDADMAVAGTQLDGTLAFDAGDANSGKTPNLVAAAYTNPDADAATGTTNFAIDATLDVLVTQGSREGLMPAVSPNTGRLFTVGALNVNAGEDTHLDIARDGRAVAVIGRQAYAINLTTGAATALGTLTSALRGFAIAP